MEYFCKSLFIRHFEEKQTENKQVFTNKQSMYLIGIKYIFNMVFTLTFTFDDGIYQTNKNKLCRKTNNVHC